MRDVSTWSGLLPKNMRDRWACLFLVINLPLIFVLQFTLVLPSVFGWNFSWACNCCAAFFLFSVFNIYANFYKLITVDASGRQSDLPSVLRPGFKYCHVCQLNAPPRAYHCSVCDECILKRDHHCIFSGCCVGLKNHRYYLMGLFYCWLASSLGLYVQWSYIWVELGGMKFSTVWYLFVPQIAFILRFISLLQFLLAVTQISTLALSIASTYLLVWQFFAISRGRTWHEFSTKATPSYDYGLRANFLLVFGTKWHIALFNPLVDSPLSSDGVGFPKSNWDTSKTI